MKQFFRQDFAFPILPGLIFVLPDPVSAVTATDQISADSDDADQDGTGTDTKISTSPLEIGQNQYIGLHFVGHGLPNNVGIQSASIQLTTEEQYI